MPVGCDLIRHRSLNDWRFDMFTGRRILLIIGGGIAAYKSLDLIRVLQKRGASIVPVMTRGASEFVTPLSVAALSQNKVFQDLFDCWGIWFKIKYAPWKMTPMRPISSP